MTVPLPYRFIIQYVTPVILIAVFAWNIPGIIDTINNTALKAQIAGTTDAAQVSQLTTQMTYVNASRFGLLLIWLGVAFLVFIAYKKRLREGRFTS